MLLMYRFFRAFPRKRRIVCLSRESDRPTTDFRLIRHYVRQTHPDYSVVILAKKLHNPVRYGFHMIRQLYFIATSQAVLLDTYAIVVSLLAGYIDVPVIQMACARQHEEVRIHRVGLQGRPEVLHRLAAEHASRVHVRAHLIQIVHQRLRSRLRHRPVHHLRGATAPHRSADQQLVPGAAARTHHPRVPGTGRKLNIVYCPTFRKRRPPIRLRRQQPSPMPSITTSTT